MNPLTQFLEQARAQASSFKVAREKATKGHWLVTMAGIRSGTENTLKETQLTAEDDNFVAVAANQGPAIADTVLRLAEMVQVLSESLKSIAAEKCKPSFDEQLPKLERGALISIVDTDTQVARQGLAEVQRIARGKE